MDDFIERFRQASADMDRNGIVLAGTRYVRDADVNALLEIIAEELKDMKEKMVK
jgi:hypothetical protein